MAYSDQEIREIIARIAAVEARVKVLEEERPAVTQDEEE